MRSSFFAGSRPGSAGLARVGAATLLAATLAACTGKDPYNPGTALGTFTVVGSLKGASCGPAETPPDPWRFEVKLSHEGKKLYWIQGGLPVSGTLDEKNHAAMKATDTKVLVAPTKDRSGCSVRRDDTLDTTLAAKEDASGKLDVESFTGTLTYRFVPVEGSDCHEAIAAGAYADLPCAVTVAVAGTPKSTK